MDQALKEALKGFMFVDSLHVTCLLAAVSLGTKITHFITLTQGQTTPVPRAKVSLFLFPYDAKPITGPACTTDTNGTCTVDVKPLISGGNYGQLAAVVEAADHGPLVVYSLPTPSSYEDESLSYSYVGDLVVDRVIVMPGDKLHVTGRIALMINRICSCIRCVLHAHMK